MPAQTLLPITLFKELMPLRVSAWSNTSSCSKLATYSTLDTHMRKKQNLERADDYKPNAVVEVTLKLNPIMCSEKTVVYQHNYNVQTFFIIS
jgi:hypothetical protein